MAEYRPLGVVDGKTGSDRGRFLAEPVSNWTRDSKQREGIPRRLARERDPSQAREKTRNDIVVRFSCSHSSRRNSCICSRRPSGP